MAGTRLPANLSASSCRHKVAWQNCGALLCAFRNMCKVQSAAQVHCQVMWDNRVLLNCAAI